MIQLVKTHSKIIILDDDNSQWIILGKSEHTFDDNGYLLKASSYVWNLIIINGKMKVKKLYLRYLWKCSKLYYISILELRK